MKLGFLHKFESQHWIALSDGAHLAKTGPSPAKDAMHGESNFGLSSLPKRVKRCSKLKHDFSKNNNKRV
jgi:hypothetical protein